MANESGKAYALTLFCPIQAGCSTNCPEGMADQTCAALVRYALQRLAVTEESPMARVPNTYLSRLFVLDDVPYQGKPAQLEHLKSQYLVFSSNFHGDLDSYLSGMWRAIEGEIRSVLQYCVGFEEVRDERGFLAYVKKCQVETTFFFNGSTDQSLAEQLKGLYLKQEFSRFVYANQGRGAEELQAAFREFVKHAEPGNLARPTWRAGAYELKDVVAS